MKNYKNQKILIIGAARQGLALARYLAMHDASVIINDKKTSSELEQARQAMQAYSIRWELGHHDFALLDGIDLLCLSGGVPLELPIVQEAKKRGIPLSNDTQIFMEQVPCRVIGITGSVGKTTTTTLVGRMVEAAVPQGCKSWVGGNIGKPLIDIVDEIQPDDIVILEISSFQLDLMNQSPQISAVLNITPNHLDRHGTMQAYTEAKSHILRFQTGKDCAILGREDPGAWELAQIVKGRLISFGFDKPVNGQTGTYLAGDTLFLQEGTKQLPIMHTSKIHLRGRHNLLNVLAASAILYAAGFPLDAAAKGVEDFYGVVHRLEFVRNYHGSAWYNDTKATTPEAVISDIRAFNEPLVVMIGGRDKHLPWENLAALIHERVAHVIVFGEAASKVLEAIGPLHPGQYPYTLEKCEKLEQAVQAAARVAEDGDVVLLSPGGTSFDEFNNFEERGERFKEWVKQLS